MSEDHDANYLFLLRDTQSIHVYMFDSWIGCLAMVKLNWAIMVVHGD